MPALGENWAGSVCQSIDATSWDGASQESLAVALMQPVTECIESALPDLSRRAGSCRRSGRRLSLTVTTRAAHRHPLAKVFVDAIESRLHFSGDLRVRIYTVLQEAIMNAVLHGNLELGSELRDSFEGLAKLDELIETRLASAKMALRAIRVDAVWTRTALWIFVRDSGTGFERSRTVPGDEGQTAPPLGSGRGLSILNAFCDRTALLHKGTVSKLGFSL